MICRRLAEPDGVHRNLTIAISVLCRRRIQLKSKLREDLEPSYDGTGLARERGYSGTQFALVVARDWRVHATTEPAGAVLEFTGVSPSRASKLCKAAREWRTAHAVRSVRLDTKHEPSVLEGG